MTARERKKKNSNGRKYSSFKNKKTSTEKHFLVLQFIQKPNVKGLIL